MEKAHALIIFCYVIVGSFQTITGIKNVEFPSQKA